MRTDRKDMMFKLRHNEPSDLDREIERIMIEMNENATDSEEYKTLLSYLERLNVVKTTNRRKPPSTDTWITAASNLLGILVIVGYEQKHVITSKALGLKSMFK